MSGKQSEVSREIRLIADKLNETKYDFVNQLPISFEKEDKAKDIIIEFLEIVLKEFDLDDETAFDNVTNFGMRIGEFALNNGARLDESIDKISNIRRLLWKHIKEQVLVLEARIDTVLEVADIFDPLFDRAIFALSTAYMNSYRENLDKAEDEFLKLSAPVVPIFKGTAVLPIIGGIDEKRADQLMKTALYEAGQRELDYLFIDLSGVSVVDTMVAYHIFKIIKSLKLIGVETVLAGIRPEVSHTMVSLGIDFAKIKTHSSLQQALSMYMNVSNQIN
ncbi:hypothetical protein CIL03_07570 [Virgibacillus indicus]|uniref:STAS domain-containing protein n=1 Tax=Virgibacillus indicus TaxID=2024554 RepID=A0A265NA18_9BACI|nr:STAS domain-containing protein [Virgibacillus indicus]OZU88872.1 hypothetical protein CIL03_07570 [Virgibacillus indicus]